MRGERTPSSEPAVGQRTVVERATCLESVSINKGQRTRSASSTSTNPSRSCATPIPTPPALPPAAHDPG
eukprot:2051012-Rhodomonas_salina.1